MMLLLHDVTVYAPNSQVNRYCSGMPSLAYGSRTIGGVVATGTASDDEEKRSPAGSHILTVSYVTWDKKYGVTRTREQACYSDPLFST